MGNLIIYTRTVVKDKLRDHANENFKVSARKLGTLLIWIQRDNVTNEMIINFQNKR